jgi:hypothetical protein
MAIENFKDQTKKEIVLMMLTYRLSLKNTAKLLNIAENEVVNLCDSVTAHDKNMTDALEILNIETKNELEEVSKIAYNNALEYWNLRNTIIKGINQAKNKKDEEKLKRLREKRKELYTEIDDTKLIETFKVTHLNEEQKEQIARFRLKYGLSLQNYYSLIHRGKDTVRISCEELSKKDPIYRDKLEMLNSYWNEISRKYKR